MRIYPFFILFFLSSFSLNIVAQTQGELLLFIQENEPVSQQLLQDDLEALQKVASSQNVDFKVVPLKEGAPELVTFTPALVFQNHLGRSLFRGRYKALGRLTNFVRAAQWEPQDDTPYNKTNIMYLKKGQTVIASPIKITPLTGELPKDFSAEVFETEARAAAAKGMSDFQYKKEMMLPASARLFYMDFYPHRDSKGNLYVSMRVYSMFNCVEQVYETTTALVDENGDVKALFEKAGAQMEQAVLSQLANTSYGDALEPLKANWKVLSFETLGLPLPQSTGKEKAKPDYKDLKAADQWVFEKPVMESLPALQFQFPSPLDHYGGEAKKMDAYFQVPDIATLKGTTGKVFVATKSITMGDAALDEHVFHEYLKTKKHPVSTYTFQITDAPNQLIPGEVQRIELTGDFEMNGKKVKLPAVGTAELIADENGEARLHITGQFSLALRQLYGIKGPDGPKEASDNLLFKLNFLMRPSSSVTDAKSFVTTAQNFTPVLANSEAKEEGEIIENELGRINWSASTKVYKAKGNFTDWKLTKVKIPNGDLEKMQVSFEIDLASITEKSSLLVKHVKSDKFLDVEVYPYARIDINGVKKKNNNMYTGEAMLELKAVTAPIPFTFEVISESPLRVKGRCQIPRKTFDVGKVKRVGGVSKMVDVEMEVLLNITPL